MLNFILFYYKVVKLHLEKKTMHWPLLATITKVESGGNANHKRKENIMSKNIEEVMMVLGQ
jgi:hypothetical protein